MEIPLQIERTFMSSASTLYHSWISPRVAELWLFKNGTNVISFRGEAREAAKFDVAEEDNGKHIDYSGTWLVLDRNKSLSFTLAAPAHFEGVSKVLLSFEETAAGCRMLFTQNGIDTSENEGLWNNMFSALDRVLELPFLITPASEAADVISAIDILVMQIQALAFSVDETKRDSRPFKNCWTVNQLLTHVMKYLQFIPGTMKAPAQPAKRNPAQNSILFARTFLDATIKFRSPDFLVPGETPDTSGFAFGMLDRTLQDFRANCLATDLSGELQGLPMGPVTKLELLFFSFYHSQRHLWQMRKITDVLTA